MERLVLWHRILPPAFEEDETTAATGEWARYVMTQVHAAGGEVISSLAGTVVAGFGAGDLQTATNLALRLLSEAEQRPVPVGGLRIAFGVAVGEVTQRLGDDGRPMRAGSAIDRAQLLANQAQGGEVVLDVESRQAASHAYLFGRTVSTASFALRGEAIDRRRPLLRQCRESLRTLQPAPIPPSVWASLQPLQKAASRDKTRLFFLRGPAGSGVRDALLTMADALKPPAFFEIGAVPGGLEPLGGLRLALLQAWQSPDRIRQALETTDPTAADALEAIACGNPPPLKTVISALQVLLTAMRTTDRLPWIYIERVAAVDLATLTVLEQALSPGTVATMVVIRTHDDGMPAVLSAIARAEHIELATLQAKEAVGVASTMLGQATDTTIAEAAMVAGGGTRLGVAEAVRTMVATGDIVPHGAAFVWRVNPHPARQPVGPSALLEERVNTLDAWSIRCLEVACAGLSASSPQVIDAATGLEGMEASVRAEAFDGLRGDGLLDARARPTSETLRRLVVQRMSAARRVEVYRLLATALRDAEPFVGPAMSATIGAYLCEAGEVQEGVRAILDAGTTAAGNGYERTAVRLAAAAVQYQPSTTTRSEASQISRAVHRPSKELPEEEDRPTIPVPGKKKAARSVDLVQALRRSDHGGFDQLIEAAIAAGADLVSAHCLRAVSFASRGDLDAAEHALEQAYERSPAREHSPTLFIASACVHLARRKPQDAMIDALEALASAREHGDARGEAASLKVLATCCAWMGLSGDAKRLESTIQR